MAQLRDAKGRFMSNKINNTKGDNTMKKTAQEIRKETLEANGIDTSAFFDLSLRVPLNAEVRISVNGKEMTIGQPAPVLGNGIAYGLPTDTCTNNDDNNCVYGSPAQWDIENDPIAQKIMENGYVKNTKLFRRWITAQTFALLNYKAYTNPNRTGWECAVKDLYGYNYQFTMMLEEIRVLGILQGEDKEAFEERSRFFNGDVVVYTLNDYYNRLKKYINKQMREKYRCYKGQPYVKLAKYGCVLVKDLNWKIYHPIENAIKDVKFVVKNGDYMSMYYILKKFMNSYYNKLPYETTKCAAWKDAFKGSGAFYSALNLVRFHKCFITEENGNKYYGSDAVEYLHILLDGEYKHEVWRFHELLKCMIRENNFDLSRSIAEGNNAPGTSVDKKIKEYDMYDMF